MSSEGARRLRENQAGYELYYFKQSFGMGGGGLAFFLGLSDGETNHTFDSGRPRD